MGSGSPARDIAGRADERAGRGSNRGRRKSTRVYKAAESLEFLVFHDRFAARARKRDAPIHSRDPGGSSISGLDEVVQLQVHEQNDLLLPFAE